MRAWCGLLAEFRALSFCLCAISLRFPRGGVKIRSFWGPLIARSWFERACGGKALARLAPRRLLQKGAVIKSNIEK